MTYYIAQSGLLPIPTPDYTQSLLNCPIDWTLVVVDDLGQEIGKTDAQTQYASVLNSGSVQLNAGSDYDILGQVWNLRL